MYGVAFCWWHEWGIGRVGGVVSLSSNSANLSVATIWMARAFGGALSLSLGARDDSNVEYAPLYADAYAPRIVNRERMGRYKSSAYCIVGRVNGTRCGKANTIIIYPTNTQITPPSTRCVLCIDERFSWHRYRYRPRLCTAQASTPKHRLHVYALHSA